ncbi:hypothetical protein VNO77_03179 [Canavalia gladiata]|uniref:Uncharacterized protein n=1 Tax=Canavalia gladiata TaxID=3824 RepID=A0AAN9MWA5_CANGL
MGAISRLASVHLLVFEWFLSYYEGVGPAVPSKPELKGDAWEESTAFSCPLVLILEEYNAPEFSSSFTILQLGSEVECLRIHHGLWRSGEIERESPKCLASQGSRADGIRTIGQSPSRYVAIQRLRRSNPQQLGMIISPL